MQNLKFLNPQGDFILESAQNAPEVYFPLVNEAGMISSITPCLAGDCKKDQNTFLLAPASEQTLTESRATRNFWVIFEREQPWSATGQSALQEAQRFGENEENCTLTGGLLWQKVARCHKPTGLKAEILSFVPAEESCSEIMQVTLTNLGKEPVTFRCAAAIPLYGRSADNLRDHRHVTSLLNRLTIETYGAALTPTLTFDERGHKPGAVTYRVWAADEKGTPPTYAVPTVKEFCGSSTLLWPEAVVHPNAPVRKLTEGESAQGGEMMGALFFSSVTLAPAASKSYQVVLSINGDPTPYLTKEAVESALRRTQKFWQKKAAGEVALADREFAPWMRWVRLQPVLRRICGCSFLPHHDYGRGGRGWRDLWQDSLALILSDPRAIRESLLCHFAGVRPDGTNATIIGAKPGEFKADRNNIPRVWMDHGFWPLLTVFLYLNETGDLAFLLEPQRYFADGFAFRGEGDRPLPLPEGYSGTVLEHLLVQNVTAFFDVGEHGNIRLRGADWNDGLDMAPEKGESVAFTAAYAGNLDTLAELLERLHTGGNESVAVSKALQPLFDFPVAEYDRPAALRSALFAYCARAYASNEKAELPALPLAAKLRQMAQQIRCRIRRQEWVGDGADQHWFNGYYDNGGRQVEGVFGNQVRMMLTGQVFTLLSSTATEEQAAQIIRAVDWYLYHPARGGYCLNTDFEEVKLDLGRMFGFAYGNKENGAVFCHMAVMYAYALYHQGFAAQGWKVLEQLYAQSVHFRRSAILPGIPEYFDETGRGMYHYLTGAASWLQLTVQTQMFGVKGEYGALVLEPKLLATQFAADNTASLCCCFGGRPIEVVYHNPKRLDWGAYRIGTVTANGQTMPCGKSRAVLKAKDWIHIPASVIHVELEAQGTKEEPKNV